MNRVAELEKLILKNKALYYQGRPEIPDLEFDKLEEELRLLDPRNAALDLIGTLVKPENKIKHDKKMLSLGKTYKLEELNEWAKKRDVVGMYKIDGVSCSIIYENGHLAFAKTRGDGFFGENVTAKVNWMSSIPKTITEKKRTEVRGEIFCTESNFFHLSEEMASLGLEKPTSQRNIVAGLIGRKEQVELNRYITFKAFDFIQEIEDFSTELEKHKILEGLGFDVLEMTLHKGGENLEILTDAARVFMSEGEYQIDGVVFSYNNLATHEELGETAHHPRYKIAFKFQGESKETKIKEIVWSVSRNGFLTPVADVYPVSLSGAIISRVTLHNYGMVKQYNLKKEDLIEIIRSGEVIPKFISVVRESTFLQAFPENCPSCGEKVFVEDIRLVCKNEACPAIVKETILNFIQKIGIDDLSSKRLDEMIKKGLVKSIDDLYLLEENDFYRLDKVKEKLATKLHLAIEKSKRVDLITFLSALGISGGAYNKCEKVVHSGFNSILKLKAMDWKKLSEVDSFAEKSSKDFVSSLKKNFLLIDSLLEKGFSFKEKEIKQTEIFSKRICITGSLSEKRANIEKKIRDSGGLVATSVTKKTDYLLTNDNNSESSKLKKAQDLGIQIISEERLAEILRLS